MLLQVFDINALHVCVIGVWCSCFACNVVTKVECDYVWKNWPFTSQDFASAFAYPYLHLLDYEVIWNLYLHEEGMVLHPCHHVQIQKQVLEAFNSQHSIFFECILGFFKFSMFLLLNMVKFFIVTFVFSHLLQALVLLEAWQCWDCVYC